MPIILSACQKLLDGSSFLDAGGRRARETAQALNTVRLGLVERAVIVEPVAPKVIAVGLFDEQRDRIECAVLLDAQRMKADAESAVALMQLRGDIATVSLHQLLLAPTGA